MKLHIDNCEAPSKWYCRVMAPYEVNEQNDTNNKKFNCKHTMRR